MVTRQPLRVARLFQVESLEARQLLSAGDPDPSFGAGGTASSSLASFFDADASFATIDGDTRNGFTVVAGDIVEFTGEPLLYNRSDTALVRFDSAGRLDRTFSGDGKAILRNFDVGDVLIQPDNKVLVAGRIWRGAPAVIRLTRGGALDTTVGGGDGVATAGRAQPDGSPFGTFSSVALGPGGKIIAARWA